MANLQRSINWLNCSTTIRMHTSFTLSAAENSCFAVLHLMINFRIVIESKFEWLANWHLRKHLRKVDFQMSIRLNLTVEVTQSWFVASINLIII